MMIRIPPRQKLHWAIVWICLLAILGGCKKESTTEPSGPEPFSLIVSVKTPGGQPVSGLRISAWNKIPFAGVNLRGQPYLAATTVAFRVGQPSRVRFNMYQVNGALYATNLQDTLSEGNYLLGLPTPEHVPTRVFKCLLFALELNSNSVLFKDSIFAVLHQPDASISIVGWTNAAGIFQSSDSLLFPNVLRLPPMIRTHPSGPQPAGTFTIPDSVVFVLTDTITHQSQSYVGVVQKKANVIQLVWNPGPATNPSENQVLYVPAMLLRTGEQQGNAQWELYQNFPNPYN